MTETPHPQTPPTQAADTQSPRLIRPSRPARIALITAALAAVVLTGLWVVRTTPWAADAADSGSGRGIAEPGLTLYPAGERDPAAPLRGRTLDDTAFDLEELEGQIVVLNVWGSWCGPCVAETPGLVRVANKTADRGVQFVGIDTRDERTAARAFAKNYKVPYPSVFDPTGQALLPFASSIPSAAIPSTLVLDAGGNVAARVIGAVDEATLAALLDDLMEEGAGGDIS